MSGGPAPWCPRAVDLFPDDRVELDDAFSLLVYANEGAASLPDRAALDCPGESPGLQGPCREVSLSVEAPARGAGSAFGATVRLRAPDLAVQGWTLGVEAEGACTLVGASTDDTAGAPAEDGGPGARVLGYDATFVRPRKATSTVLLGLTADHRAPAPADLPLLRLALAADPPASGCAACALTVGAPVGVLGPALDTVIVADGLRYAPPPVTARVEVCAP